MSIKDDTSSLISLVAATVNGYRHITGYYKTASLVSASKLSRVEPLVVISRDCLNLPYLVDVEQSLLSIFSSYYLRTIALMAQVKDVKIMKILDKLTPDRDYGSVFMATESLQTNRTLCKGAYSFRLPTSANAIANEAFDKEDFDKRDLVMAEKEAENASRVVQKLEADFANADKRVKEIELDMRKLQVDIDQVQHLIENLAGDPNASTKQLGALNTRLGNLTTGMEKFDLTLQAAMTNRNNVQKNLNDARDKLAIALDVEVRLTEAGKERANEPGKTKQSINYDTKPIMEISNLAVGKLLNVEIQIDNNSMKYPVQVNLAPCSLTNASILHILARTSEDHSFTERFHSWRAGRISLINDLIFCQDMIREHKKALMEDTEGVISEIVRRANNAKGVGLLTQNPSLASASSLFVISSTVARELENKLGGKLSNMRIREKAFENSYAMIIAVIDPDMERVTFYHDGINAATDVSIREISASNKSKGPDIMDMLNLYKQGAAPTF